MKRVILIGYSFYGDYLSLNGMVNYLLYYYDIIYYIVDNKKHNPYLKEIYKNKRVIITTTKNASQLLLQDPNFIDVINTCIYFNLDKLLQDKPYKNYYNYNNLLYNKLKNIDKNNILDTNKNITIKD